MVKIEPFVPTQLEEERNKNDIKFSVRIMPDEITWFEHAKRIIQQPKNSTALKQLAKVGYELVIHDKKIIDLLDTVVNNSRRNLRTGVTDSEYKIK